MNERANDRCREAAQEGEGEKGKGKSKEGGIEICTAHSTGQIGNGRTDVEQDTLHVEVRGHGESDGGFPDGRKKRGRETERKVIDGIGIGRLSRVVSIVTRLGSSACVFTAYCVCWMAV